MKRKITVELEQRFVIRRNGHKSANMFCACCCKDVEMFSTDEAALLAGRSSRVIFGWVELGWLHYTETNESLLLICRESLENLIAIK